MRIPRLYIDQTINTGELIELEGSSAHYLSRVLRMEAGRPLILFNGQGGEYQAEIHALSKKTVSLKINAHVLTERESPLPIHIGIGISRGERMDWVLQKATELGVTSITPLFTERTEVRLKGERLDKKQQHWQQILISACEQCQRNRLPELNSACALEDWIPQAQDGLRYVLHHRSDGGLPDNPQRQPVSLLIGPEGGLSDDEISAAQAHQFKALTLGPRVMRTETAPIAALSVLQFLWGDLG